MSSTETKTIEYKGCQITRTRAGWVWDEISFGAESDEMFATVEAAKANIDLFFGSGPAPREINGEIFA